MLAVGPEFLSAWSMVRRYGVQGFLALHPGETPHPEFGPALVVMDGELARLEQEELKRERRKQQQASASAAARRR